MISDHGTLQEVLYMYVTNRGIDRGEREEEREREGGRKREQKERECSS